MILHLKRFCVYIVRSFFFRLFQRLFAVMKSRTALIIINVNFSINLSARRPKIFRLDVKQKGTHIKKMTKIKGKKLYIFNFLIISQPYQIILLNETEIKDFHQRFGSKKKSFIKFRKFIQNLYFCVTFYFVIAKLS